MAHGEGSVGKTEDKPAHDADIIARYLGARARLMGRMQVARAASADAAPKTRPAPVSGPACWRAELIAFNEELRRLFLRRESGGLGDRIRAVVAAHYDISVAEICGGSSTRRCAWPRQVAMYICARQAALPTPSIAELFGNRDHSTVLSAVRSVAARAATDAALKREISELMAKCRRGRLP